MNNFYNSDCLYAYDGPQYFDSRDFDTAVSSYKVTKVPSCIENCSQSFVVDTNISRSTVDSRNSSNQDIDDDLLEIEIIDISNSQSSAGNDYDNKKDADDVDSEEIDDSICILFKLPAVISDRRFFALLPASQNILIKCRLIRDKSGLEKGFYPTYHLYLEGENDNPDSFLLAARRRKRSTSSNYIITSKSSDLKRKSESFVGKLRSNLMGTNYVVFDYGKESNSSQKLNGNYKFCRRELAGISYDTEMIGIKGPRKIAVVIPDMNENRNRIEFYKNKDTDSLLGCWKKKKMQDLLVLRNKRPIDDSHSYISSFHGRVTQHSVKNFQLVHDNNVDLIVMQFGKLSNDVFSLDFSYPFCALQAFGIALSSFDSKLSCE